MIYRLKGKGLAKVQESVKRGEGSDIEMWSLCVFMYLMWLTCLAFTLPLFIYVCFLHMIFTFTFRFIFRSTGWFFESGRILFFNSFKTKWATCKFHGSKEAEIHGILFDTCDRKYDNHFFAICSKANLVSFTKMRKRWIFQQM